MYSLSKKIKIVAFMLIAFCVAVVCYTSMGKG